MPKEIKLTFEWDGKTVHKETEGFTGNECVDDTEFIEKALGKTGKRTYTSEYYNESEKENEDRLRY